jgi:maltoporin
VRLTRLLISLLILAAPAAAFAQPAPEPPGDEGQPAESDPPRARPEPAAEAEEDVNEPVEESGEEAGADPGGAAPSGAVEERAGAEKTHRADVSTKGKVVVDEPERPEKKPGKKANEEKSDDTGFAFGSYGRVRADTDGHGSSAKPINVVTHGTRLEESTYLELDLYYKMRPSPGVEFRTVTTLGFKEDLFHYTGDWSSRLAIRNLYLEAVGLFHPGLSIWAGSRQYRGDDIYLLDFWPLDNLNTVGAGAKFRFGRSWVAFHGGVNRLRDEYQYQVVPVPGLNNTSEDVVVLDRQKLITSLKGGHRIGGTGGKVGFKVMGYSELHLMGSGTYNPHLAEEEQVDLPADQGWLVGVQLGAWNFGQRNTHANLFIHYAEGLAAYGEMAIPWGVARDRKAGDAKEFQIAFSGNYEWGMLGVMAGGYVRYFKDADTNDYDWDDGWEYIVAVRPRIQLHKHFAQAFEISHQGRWPFGLEPRSESVQRPAITKLSVLPTITFGKASYDRPQLRLVYTLALLNRGARLAYNPVDPRADREVQHYIGIQAEWWYNSTYR